MKTTTKEKGRLFSGDMVRAIKEGRKTQTRRIIKPQPELTKEGQPYWHVGGFRLWPNAANPLPIPHPIGSRFYVRETWRVHGGREYEYQHHRPSVIYKADIDTFDQNEWRPSIHMPRWASRIDGIITDVRVERFLDISDADVLAEGFNDRNEYLRTVRRMYQIPITGPDRDPWLFAYTFKAEVRK